MSYTFCDGTLIDRSHNILASGSVATALERNWLSDGAAKLREIAHTQLHLALQELGSREENWDGRGSAAAQGQSIFEAAAILEAALRDTARLAVNWVAPHLGLDEHGCVVMEWWNGRNKLTIYMTPGSPEFVCSWGQHIENHMESGLLTDQFPELWRWLWTWPN